LLNSPHSARGNGNASGTGSSSVPLVPKRSNPGRKQAVHCQNLVFILF